MTHTTRPFKNKKISAEEMSILVDLRRLKWRTAENKTMSLEDMDSSHIRNCITLLKKRNLEQVLMKQEITGEAHLRAMTYILRKEQERLVTTVVNKYHDHYDIYIGRGSRWGNPFEIGTDGNRREVIKKYAEWIKTQSELLLALPDLHGKILGCFCKPAKCHGDILAKLCDNLYKQSPENFEL